MLSSMSEIAEFVRHRASLVTPRVVEKVLSNLPLLKAEFTQIDAPEYPHLVDQLEFLADVVEDFFDGELVDLPYSTAAAATFALIYAHQMIDLIPDSAKDGRADDSAVVRAVLTLHEKPLAAAAEKLGVNWNAIAHRP
ncbi:MAG: hypothetical protein OHK005_01850 [Candidatus Methylacidiphilales bacterium]